MTPAVVEPATVKPATVKPQAVRKPAAGRPDIAKAAFGKGAGEDHPTTVSDSAKVESPTEIIRPEALPRRARAHLAT